jgi:transposase-like protein
MSSSATRVPSAEEAAGWVHFTILEANRRQIRSTNPLERLNRELKDGD